LLSSITTTSLPSIGASDPSGPGVQRSHAGLLSFLSTVTVFGAAVDLNLAVLSLEVFYPAVGATQRVFQMGKNGAKP
jgi:hypothetical protein